MMGLADFVQIPLGVRILVLVMLWPAIWAGASFIVAFAGDVIRHRRERMSPALRHAA